jgi:hypothetical protein
MNVETSPELPDPLLRLIASAIPTYLAAEVLLFLAARPERAWKPEEIVVEMRPVVITLPAAKEYLALFQLRNIVQENSGSFRFEPSTRELENELEPWHTLITSGQSRLFIQFTGLPKCEFSRSPTLSSSGLSDYECVQDHSL